MKKFLAVIMCMVLVLSLGACAKDEPTQPESKGTEQGVEKKDDTVAKKYDTAAKKE